MIGTATLGLSAGEVFCGAGGLSHGFRNTGLDVTFALDKAEDSCRTYERNFGAAPEHALITDFAPSDLARRLRGVAIQSISAGRRAAAGLPTWTAVFRNRYLSAT